MTVRSFLSRSFGMMLHLKDRLTIMSLIIICLIAHLKSKNADRLIMVKTHILFCWTVRKCQRNKSSLIIQAWLFKKNNSICQVTCCVVLLSTFTIESVCCMIVMHLPNIGMFITYIIHKSQCLFINKLKHLLIILFLLIMVLDLKRILFRMCFIWTWKDLKRTSIRCLLMTR
jgi:hypothetical protein